MNPGDYLKQIAEDLAAGTVRRDTVRALLAKFGFQRRGSNKAATVKAALKGYKLTTDPDLLVPYIDESVEYRLISAKAAEAKPEVVLSDAPADAPAAPSASDPTYRINKLEAANLEAAGKKLVFAAPSASVDTAVTEMLACDFSQLPVMNGNTVKGVISWRSLGKRLALGQTCKTVQDAMDDAAVVRSDTSIFQAIHDIVQHDYVLVQREDKSIAGIVTTSDLSVQFRTLSEPFLILSEIENHLRPMIDAKFDKSELKSAVDPSDGDREVNTASDLTFGEYERLLENEGNWAKLGLLLDRKTFIRKLDAVRVIRNDVMHFDPEGIAEQDLETLRAFVKFLQELRAVVAF